MTEPGDSDEMEADAAANEVMSGKVCRKISGGGAGGGMAVSSQMESQLNHLQGGGQSMPAGLRGMMERGFDRDFSQVRLHTDSEAAGLSSSINAKAFTHGNDIYFNRGQFSPETSEGQRLVAHELAHVAQGGGKVGRKRSNEKVLYEKGDSFNGVNFKIYLVLDEDKGKYAIFWGKKNKEQIKKSDGFWITASCGKSKGEVYISPNTKGKIEIKTDTPITLSPFGSTSIQYWCYTPKIVNIIFLDRKYMFYGVPDKDKKYTFFLEQTDGGKLEKGGGFWFFCDYEGFGSEVYITSESLKNGIVKIQGPSDPIENLDLRNNHCYLRPWSHKKFSQSFQGQNGQKLNLSEIRMPIEGNNSFVITQGFDNEDKEATHNSKYEQNVHAVDISTTENNGIPIVAVAEGRVVKVVKGIDGKKNIESQFAEGNCVYILHENNYISVYAHLKNDRFLPNEGDLVNLGQRIGTMGNTGNSSGTHLHFSILRYDDEKRKLVRTDWSLDGIGDVKGMQDDKINKKGTVDDAGQTTWEKSDK
ncbi:MAG: DUF4157 domain-containing protein [Paludibacteraceae bacterium]|nr:DUF4157 domain-containing protein [Paludibacteraceae bacterium]